MSLVLRARKHTEELDARLREYLATDPWECIAEPNPSTGKDIHKLRLTTPLPQDIPPIARDAIINLRDALDHMVYASAVALGAPKETKKTKFPFAESLYDLRRQMGRNDYEHIPPELFLIIEWSKPSRHDGDKVFWAFNELRNIKVHRTLRSFTVVFTNQHYYGGRFVGTGIKFLDQVWDGVKNEMPYMETTSGAEFSYRANLNPAITLADFEFLNKRLAVDLLVDIRGKICEIGEKIENETNRLLASRR